MYDYLNSLIKRYWQIFQITWQESLEYRAELFLWSFVEIFPLIAMVIVWLNIYGNGQTIADYSLPQLITYYVLGFLYNRFTNVNIELDYVEEVRTGEISRFLIKPFSLRQIAVLQELAWRFQNILLIGLPIIALLIFLSPPIPSLSFANLILLVIITITTFFINATISMIILALAFYIDQGKTLSHFKWMLEGIFSGSLLPLAAYPPALKYISQILPFQFKFAVPINILLFNPSLTETFKYTLLALTWLIILNLTMKHTWNKALKRFTAVGN